MPMTAQMLHSHFREGTIFKAPRSVIFWVFFQLCWNENFFLIFTMFVNTLQDFRPFPITPSSGEKSSNFKISEKSLFDQVDARKSQIALNNQ